MKKTYNTYKKSGVNMANVDKLANYLSEYQEKLIKCLFIEKKIYFNFCVFYAIRAMNGILVN